MKNNKQVTAILCSLMLMLVMIMSACEAKEDEVVVSSEESTQEDVLGESTTTYSSDFDESEDAMDAPTDCESAVEQYIIEKIGLFFDESDICIPFMDIIAMDDRDSSDIKVWGIYWIYNYEIDNDTLVCVSGGSNPGLMHVEKTDGIYTAKAFEIVSDGSKKEESEQEIFGEYLEKYKKIMSNEKAIKKIREKAIVKYVKEHNLKVKKYQDEGEKPVTLDL
ncbi:hypothetical protein [Eubacterium oxidoreducens]|uniref:Uncharacterized protein n=1 Tax=Eubacterium oxidoreducens TaxID=1732 RepID=A0A1G6BIU1_EUBOX|nr:hypothetical protein [Eubacterium oxidoreducens]SDB20513.1 hypothetical protein SAMN02910417_01566 [Eubacterium oxidoreducens]